MNLIDQCIEAVMRGQALPEEDSFTGDPPPYNYSSSAAEASASVKVGAGYLFGFSASNANAAARFIQLYDRTTIPGTGAIPVASFQVAAAASTGVAWIPPRAFRSGIVIVSSTTQNTFTAGGADHIFDAQYV